MKKWKLILTLLVGTSTLMAVHAPFLMAEEKDPAYLHREAEQLIAVSRFEEALKLYQDAALNSPDDDEAYAKMGSLYKIRGQSQKAIQAYETALSINPNNEEALENLTTLKHPDGQTNSEILSD